MHHWPKHRYQTYSSTPTTPSLFGGTTRSSISSAYSHASPAAHYPAQTDQDVSLDALIENVYGVASSPPTIDSGLLAGINDIPMDMIGVDIDMGAVSQTYDARAMDEFFGKMHELGIDTGNPVPRPPTAPPPVPQPQQQPQPQAPSEPTPMLSGRKEKRRLNNYSLKDFKILHTLGTGSFGRVHLGWYYALHLHIMLISV